MSNLVTAKERRSKTFQAKEKKQKTARRIAEEFCHGHLAKHINEADGTCVNPGIPSEAYEHTDEFYRICKEILEKKGYKAERSHDGAGQYDTLYVSW